MSKNQRSAIFQATKKPNSVFRLKSLVVIKGGTKLSLNLQSQNIEEPTLAASALRAPFLAGFRT